MKNNSNLLFGLVICLAVAGYYGYLIMTSGALSHPAPNTQPPETTASTLSLSSETFKILHDRAKNGNLPITLDQSELGNTSPF